MKKFTKLKYVPLLLSAITIKSVGSEFLGRELNSLIEENAQSALELEKENIRIEEVKRAEKERTKEILELYAAADLAFIEATARNKLDKLYIKELEELKNLYIKEQNLVKGWDDLRSSTFEKKKKEHTDEKKKRDEILKEFTTQLDVLKRTNTYREKTKIQFLGGAELLVWKDVLDLISTNESLKSAEGILTCNTIHPSVAKKIFLFLEVQLLKKNACSLSRTYNLAEPNTNLLDFVKKNKDLLNALIQLKLLTLSPCILANQPICKDNVHTFILKSLCNACNFTTYQMEIIIIGILDSLNKIEDEEYPAILNAYNALSINLSIDCFVRLIETLRTKPSTREQSFIDIVNLIQAELAPQYKYEIITFASNIPLELHTYMQNFIADNPGFFRTIGIERLRTTFDNITQIRLQLWLENEHREALRRNRAPINDLYFRGVNVHDGDRDNKSAHAMTLLLKHQRNTVNVFLDQYKDFESNIDTTLDIVITDAKKRNETETRLDVRDQNETTIAVKTEDKTRIKQVLGLPSVPQLAGFGSFLNGSIASYGLQHMNAKEFLGRFWYFISQIEDPNDRTNAQISLMTGLADSIETDGHLVCNPGKIQRMIVAVLQGRLAGVNVDNVDFITPFSIDQKNAIEENLLIEYCQDGTPNAGRIFKALNWDKALQVELAKYVKHRMTAVASMLAKEDIQQASALTYASQEQVDLALSNILARHQDIAEDTLLHGYLKHLLKVEAVEEAVETEAAAPAAAAAAE